MTPRYVLKRDTLTWLVFDKTTKQAVAHFATRQQARDRVRELNASHRRGPNAPEQAVA